MVCALPNNQKKSKETASRPFHACKAAYGVAGINAKRQKMPYNATETRDEAHAAPLLNAVGSHAHGTKGNVLIGEVRPCRFGAGQPRIQRSICILHCPLELTDLCCGCRQHNSLANAVIRHAKFLRKRNQAMQGHRHALQIHHHPHLLVF